MAPSMCVVISDHNNFVDTVTYRDGVTVNGFGLCIGEIIDTNLEI